MRKLASSAHRALSSRVCSAASGMTCTPDGQTGGLVLSHERERPPPQPLLLSAALQQLVHRCRMLAFAEFKEGSFQLEPSEIPFQPL